ncbi:MAG: tetratricopeptide repeat protein [Terracidiphilus sp.]
MAAAAPLAGSAQAKPAPAPSRTNQPASFQAIAAKATTARDAERLDEAVPLFRQALKLNPRWAEGWWSLGTIEYDQDRYAEAALYFQKVVALEPKHGTARALLGLCEFQLGQDANALRDIEASKNLGLPEDPRLRQVLVFHEGVLLQRAGRFEGAQEALGSLCQSGVTAEQVRLALGMVVLRMRDANPPAPGTEGARVAELLGRGACLSAQKRYDAARREFASAEAAFPHYPHLHYAYGRFLVDARDTAGAVEEFKKEIAEDPNSVLARLRIGAAEYKVDSAAGLPYAQEAVRLAPQLPFTHYMLGLLLLDTGDYAGAIPQLETARKAFPQNARIPLALGSAYAHVGRPEDAARARAEFLRLSHAAGNAAASAAPDQSSYTAPQIEIKDGMDAPPRP